MKPDEREVMRRFRAGDKQAFDILFECYADRVLGFALRLTGNRADAEDLVQEVFIAAYTGCASFEGRSKLLSWLLGIVVRRWRDRRRRQTPEMVELNESAEAEACASSNDRNRVEVATINAVSVSDALDSLAPPFREALLLVASQGLTYKEAAVVLEEPVGTVKWRVSEAARKVRQILKEAEVEFDGMQ